MIAEPKRTRGSRFADAAADRHRYDGTVSRPRFVRMSLALGLLAPILIVLISTAAIGREPGHNLVSDTFSDLGAQDATNPVLIRVGMVAFGLMIVGFAAGLACARTALNRLVPVAIAIFGASVVCAGVFQDYSEEPGAPRNAEGFAHNAFGIAAIVGILTATILTLAPSRGRSVVTAPKPLALVTAIAVTGAALMFNFGPARFGGAVEMVMYVAALAWLFSTARSHLRSGDRVR